MKYVKIAELKSHLSEHLRAVRGGYSLIVMDRQTPIARIVPYEVGPGSVVIRKPREGAPRLGELPMPPPVKLDVDVMDVLREEREERDLWE